MFLRAWRFITLILAALSMGMAFCHTLELPAKMQYDAALWTTINQSLYKYFGLVGGWIEFGAVLTAIALSFFIWQYHGTLRERKRRSTFYWTLTGAIFLALALVVWFVFVAPMNAEFAKWTVDSIPADWMRVRNQWEHSHATRFVLQLIGFSALLLSILVEIPKNRSRDRVPDPMQPVGR